MQTEGVYYDGKSSKRHVVRLSLQDDRLKVIGEHVELTLPLAQVKLAAALGSMQRSLYLPDGGKCDFRDKAFARRIESERGGGFAGCVHRWENSLKYAFAALLITLALVIGFIQYGIPTLAERAALAVPPQTETTLGRETLHILDRALLEPTRLDAADRAEVERLFGQVVNVLDATERPYRLELRRSPKIGANAFALPGGIVIMTDELVEMAGNGEEIAAVLAHEVGHVRHRHAMRQVIQDSTVGLIVATLTGDIFSASSLAAALPTMLVDAKFSRDMEREADDVAVEYLRKQGQPVDHFATILNRMEQAFIEKHGGTAEEGRPTSYFSSHPATASRIERLRR